MAASVGSPPRFRGWQWGWLLLGLLVAGAIWLGTLLPLPWGAWDRDWLERLQLFAFAAAALLVLSWLVWSALRARSEHPLLAGDGIEEPLLGPSHIMACRSRSPVVTLVGLEPGSGVSTLAFNLAVSLAIQGAVPDENDVRGARPVCLLFEGALSQNLGLSAKPLEEYLSQHPYRVDPDLANFPVHHASGCELLCLVPNGLAADQLQLLVAELRHQYDAVLLDGGCGPRLTLDVAVDLSDALLLLGLPSASAVDAAGQWIERVWSLGLEDKTALLINRVAAWPLAPRELSLAFLYQAQLPDEPGVLDYDAQGLPWSIDGRLCAARRLEAIVRQLFPTLVPGAAEHAA